MNSYKLKFSFCYIECSNFKEKELIIFKNIISNSRLGRNVIFNCYANITFDSDDKKHEYPIINELETFARSKTNGIIFDIPVGDYNDGTFEKVLLYQTTKYQTSNKNTGCYGLLFFNRETNLNSHVYNIDYDINDLIQHLQHTISNISFRKTYNEYMEKSKALKNIIKK